MALRYWPILVLSAVSVVLPSAHTQTGSGAGGGSVSYSISYSEFIRGVKGMPFSAEFVSTTVRTLADGTHITDEQKRFEARDSEGRTRNETYLPGYVAKLRNQPADQPMFITIVDPVGGKQIHLNPRQKTATITSYAPIQAGQPTQRVAASQPIKPPQTMLIAQSSKENLGGKTIDGVYANGTRHTMVYPAGAQGNDHDITVISERWISPELGVEVLVKTNDPRNGEHTTELQNLSRTEPDPALFEVPSGYKIEPSPEPTQHQ